ncbi:hypothetical protein TNCV_3678601 [Trichonephila clavipes]|nr:hypothetical protein TNCV_3678601 [Trichonephila clavipes]
MMTRNKFTATLGDKNDHCDASIINDFFSTRQLKGRINVDYIDIPATVQDWLLKHHRTPLAFTRLGSCVGVMSRKGPGLGSEKNIKHTSASDSLADVCSLLIALNEPTLLLSGNQT